MPTASGLIVNSVGDEPDSAVGDGHCDTDGNPGNGDQCTLRAAIQEVNPTPANEIGFNLPPNSTIVLNSELDGLTGMTITGPGSNLLTVMRSTAVGTPNFRVLTVTAPAVATISGLTITNGQAPKGSDGAFGGNGSHGGGIFNSGDLRLVDVVVVGNRAGDGGQGQGLNSIGGSGGSGGGILSGGPLSLINCVVSGNKAGDGGAGGSGGLGGSSGGVGAGSSVTIINSTMSNNTAGKGGDGGMNGGGPGGTGGRAGGISVGGVITILNSTISGNTSGRGGNGPGFAGAFGGEGGGIANSGRLTLVNSTISDNVTGGGGTGTREEGGGGSGGGIWNIHPQMILVNSTITGNRTTGFYGGSGGGISSTTSSAIAKNTIIANNSVATGGAVDGVGPDVSGGLMSEDYNLIENTSGVSITGATAHNIIGVDPKLGSLANNGGQIQTHALFPGSPAIDAGGNSNIEPDAFDLDNDGDTAEPTPFDARGVSFPRVVNGTVDIGAFEGTAQTGPLQLLRDLSGPAVDQVAALSSVSFLRDPFPVLDDFNLSSSSDRNTRVIIFVANLQLAEGEAASSIVVNLVASDTKSFDIPAEDARPVPNLDITQVIFRLPDNLPAGTCILKVKAHEQVSNAGTIRIIEAS